VWNVRNVRSFAFEGHGGLQVEAIPGSEHILAADTVIFAVGEEPDLGFLKGAGEFNLAVGGPLKSISTRSPLRSTGCLRQGMRSQDRLRLQTPSAQAAKRPSPWTVSFRVKILKR